MSFNRPITGFRLARILVGDTLRSIALREMGDAGRWVELVYLNELSTPYLVATSAEAAVQIGTLYYGQQIKVPAPKAAYSAVSDPDAVYGVDIVLNRGAMQVVNGDLSLVAGLPNLRQAIGHRIDTEPGELERHPEYGCYVRSLIGEKASEVSALLGQWYIQRALSEEPRIDRAASTLVSLEGDVLRVEAEVVPVIENTPIDLNLVLQ